MESHRYRDLLESEEFGDKEQVALRSALKDASEQSINKLLRLAGVGEKGRARKVDNDDDNRTCGGDSAAVSAALLLVASVVGGQMQVPLTLKVSFIISFFLELVWLQLAVFSIIVFKERGPRVGTCHQFIDIWLITWPVLLVVSFLVAQVHKIKRSRRSLITLAVFGFLQISLSVVGFAFILPSTDHDCGNVSQRGKVLVYLQIVTFIVSLSIFGMTIYSLIEMSCFLL